MTTSVKKQSFQRKPALIAGTSLLIMALAAFFSMALHTGVL
ncbi:hypothetical protein [Bacillus cereus]